MYSTCDGLRPTQCGYVACGGRLFLESPGDQVVHVLLLHTLLLLVSWAGQVVGLSLHYPLGLVKLPDCVLLQCEADRLLLLRFVPLHLLFRGILLLQVCSESLCLFVILQEGIDALGLLLVLLFLLLVNPISRGLLGKLFLCSSRRRLGGLVGLPWERGWCVEFSDGDLDQLYGGRGAIVKEGLSTTLHFLDHLKLKLLKLLIDLLLVLSDLLGELKLLGLLEVLGSPAELPYVVPGSAAPLEALDVLRVNRQGLIGICLGLLVPL